VLGAVGGAGSLAECSAAHSAMGACNCGRSYLLNFTPADSAFTGSELQASQTWIDPYSSVSLTESSVTFNVSVNNDDSSSCESKTFALGTCQVSTSVNSTSGSSSALQNMALTAKAGRTLLLSRVTR
jgi:hypothetical protein